MTKEEFQGQFALIETMCQEAAQYRDYNPAMAIRIREALHILSEQPEHQSFCEEHLQKQDFMSCAKELVVRWNENTKKSTEEGTELSGIKAELKMQKVVDNENVEKSTESTESIKDAEDNSTPILQNSIPSTSVNSVVSVELQEKQKRSRRGRKEEE